MTILSLFKTLEGLVNNGYGRRPVCVDKSTFSHPLESDGAVILLADSASLDTHEMLSDEGGWKELANGTIATRTALVIRGITPPTTHE